MSEERADYGEQPNPTDGQANVTPVLRTLLIDMLDARAAAGLERYGKPLQTHNGRDAERDLLEELIDAAQYAVQSRMEREDMHAEIEQLQALLARTHDLLTQYAPSDVAVEIDYCECCKWATFWSSPEYVQLLADLETSVKS